MLINIDLGLACFMKIELGRARGIDTFSKVNLILNSGLNNDTLLKVSFR